MKELKLKFTLNQWVSKKLLKNIPLKTVDSTLFSTKEFKDKCILENAEKNYMKEFLNTLLKKKNNNKDLIKEAYINNKPDPFPDLIEAPSQKYLYRRIINNLEKIENVEIYENLLKNNGIKSYRSLIDNLSINEIKSERLTFYCDYKDEPHVHIFKHAIMMCPSNQIQSAFNYLKAKYKKIEKIDSQKEQKEKESEFQYDFHKSLRQVDLLGNPHSEMIIWNLLQITDIPHKIIKLVINHGNINQK